jgi:oligopeptide transport system ATP-binding protein
MENNILEVRNLAFSFHTYGGVVKSVRGVDFDLRAGEILGIVGESGCGKSVTAQCILKLNPEPPGFFESGSILYGGRDIVPLRHKEMRAIRSKEIGFISQDPMTSLNPTMRVGDQITEVFAGAPEVTRAEAKSRALEAMRQVGISDPERRFRQYPHELSGGMRQRVMIAVALVAKPAIVIADEPTTSLDVTIEAQILELLLNMREKTGCSIILITHDLGVIAKVCDRVQVMYGGQVMEYGDVDNIFYQPRHPYTQGLLHSIPRIDMEKTEILNPIEGTPPDLFAPPHGCPFAARCDYAMQICLERPAQEHEVAPGHHTCCWLEHAIAREVLGEEAVQ